ncbi:MAG: hypothetical protein KatS3mg083_509 [Candidatus Dojkabacteria bacterium]|nr:MAG: hypothetical protein KatS3mg083_509 [Candidatus Dojkabacteria bacterium]
MSFKENNYKLVSVTRTCGCQSVSKISDGEWKVCFERSTAGKQKSILYNYLTPDGKQLRAILTLQVPKKS